jgi:CBS domain-containing protein
LSFRIALIWAAVASVLGTKKDLRAESVDIRAPAFVCHGHTTLKGVIEKLVATKAHRLYVVDSDAHMHPIGVISVSDIIVELLKE